MDQILLQTAALGQHSTFSTELSLSQLENIHLVNGAAATENSGKQDRVIWHPAELQQPVDRKSVNSVSNIRR